MDITGIGAVADLVKSGIDRFFPSKTEEEKAQMALVMTVVQGQLETNKVEAGSTSLFVAGWRPAVGWVCAAGCAWNWIGLPVTKAICEWSGHPLHLEQADLTQMLPLLLGMLGLSASRTVEKVNGVAAGH